jgi:PAS domain S-box-containing protein
LARTSKRRDDDLEDLFENGAIGIHLVGPDGTILRANRAELDLLGYTPEEYIGHNIREFHADADAIQDILTCLSRGERLNWYPARLRAKNGSIKYVEITSSVRFKDGEFMNTRCFTRDVTELRAAQKKLEEKERYLEDILNALPAAVYTTDAEGKITYFNQQAVHMAGRVPALGDDEWCVTWRLRNEDGTPLPHDECPMAIALKENRPVRGAVAYAERPDGKLVPFTPYPTPIHNERGELIGGVNMLIDITEQKQREKQIEFVMNELSHRSKNLLAVVMAVANRTIRTSENLDEFQDKFMQRIGAMARAHDLLVKNSWIGADIREVVEAELTRYLGEHENRMTLKGQSILLKPNVAQSLSLAVHELATNAMKYGALAVDTGLVEIEWSERDDSSISFAWREKAALKVSAQSSPGFGSHVLGSLFRESATRLTPTGLNFSGVLDHARANTNSAVEAREPAFKKDIGAEPAGVDIARPIKKSRVTQPHHRTGQLQSTGNTAV